MKLSEHTKSLVDHTQTETTLTSLTGAEKERSINITSLCQLVSNREDKLKYGTSVFLEIVLFSNCFWRLQTNFQRIHPAI